MSRTERLVYLFLLGLGILLTASFAYWWFQPHHLPDNFSGRGTFFDLALFGLLTYVVWHQIINELFIWQVAWKMKKIKWLRPEPNKKVAFLTAFVPEKEPYDILERTLRAMMETDYPHDTWLLDEGDDPRAQEICRRLGVNHYSRKGKSAYNTAEGPYKMKTKGGNYNSWFDQYSKNYDYVAQLDVDFSPKKNFLIRTLGYFRHPQVAFVGTPQIYGNQETSWIARGAAEQAFNFYGSTQRGLFGDNMLLFIGANHVVRVSAHNQIGGYSGHIVEDHLTGMKFYAHRWQSIYVPEILAVGEGPASWDAYFSQQMRWAYGLIDILFTQSPRIFLRMKIKHALNYFFLQQYYFDGLAQAIGIFLLVFYFFFGLQSTRMEFGPLILSYLPVVFIQQVIFLWLQRFNIDKQNERGLLLKGRYLNVAAWPIYFLALVGVIMRKRLAYKVTPKGSAQTKNTNLLVFLPHFIFGTLTFAGIFVSFFNHHQALQFIFFGVLNTVFMYSFVFREIIKKIRISFTFSNLSYRKYLYG